MIQLEFVDEAINFDVVGSFFGSDYIFTGLLVQPVKKDKGIMEKLFENLLYF